MEAALIREDAIKTEVYITRTELAIVKMAVQGKTAKEVAHALGKAQKTVETQRHNVLKRWKCNSMPQLVGLLFQKKILVWNGDILA